MATSEWVPLSVACGRLFQDTRLDGEHPADVLAAGFAVDAPWTRTTDSGREIDVANFYAVTVTIRGEPDPVRDAADAKAHNIWYERVDIDREAAETKSDDLREKLQRYSEFLTDSYDRLHAKSV